MGTTETLARFVIETGYNDFPKEAVELAKGYILDCIGHTIGGSGEEVSQRLMNHLRESGGKPEVGVTGGRFKTTVPNACWVNGTSAHALELEAAGRFGGSNYSPLIPSALALGEMLGASGKSVIEAFILGVEIQGKVGLGSIGAPNRGYIGFMYGPIGVAAIAAKLMKFDTNLLTTSLGLAIPYCGGFRRSTGTMAHLLDSGTAARDGVVAAFLAKAGITACQDLIEGWEGFGEVYCEGEQGGYDFDAMTRDLGKPFYIISPGTSAKSYGCCVQNDRALDAIFKLIEQYDIYYDQVESVEVETPPHTGKMLRFNEPRNGEEAKFSLKHSLAAALLMRKPEMPWTAPFTDERAVDPKYKEARAKIDWKIRTDLPMTRVHTGEQKVALKMRDGRVLTNAVDASNQRGARGKDLSREDRLAIFRSCVKGKISDAQAERLVTLISNLEEIDNVREIAEIMTSAQV